MHTHLALGCGVGETATREKAEWPEVTFTRDASRPGRVRGRYVTCVTRRWRYVTHTTHRNVASTVRKPDASSVTSAFEILYDDAFLYATNDRFWTVSTLRQDCGGGGASSLENNSKTTGALTRKPLRQNKDTFHCASF